MSGGGIDMTCPNCGAQMLREGTGIGCHTCGMYIGPGPGGGAGVSIMSPQEYIARTRERRSHYPFQDWSDFHIHEGSKVSFQALDGQMFTGTVQHIEENEETGEIQITLTQFDPPQALGYPT
jgi:hypothetical protein